MNLNSCDKALIVGSQYFIDKKLNTIKSDDVEEHVFYADELVVDEFLSLATTISLFNDTRLLILHRADILKKPENFLLALARPLAAKVILTASDAKKAETLQKSLKGFQLFIERKGNNPKEIEELFSERGLEITSSCANQIGTTLSWDMSKIVSEAEKLSLYYAGKGDVSPQELLNRIDGESHGDMWKFFEAFMERQPDKCIKIFSKLEDPEDRASQIFYMLTTYISGVYFKLKVPALYNAKNPLFNGKDYFMRTVDANIRQWRAEEAYRMTERMMNLDLEIKTGKIEPHNALFCLIGALK